MRTNGLTGSGLLSVSIALLLAVTCCAGGKTEITLKLADCPPSVQKAISEHAGGAVFSKVEAETKKDGRVFYEAKAKTADGRKIKIKVAADGTLVEFKGGNDD